MILNRYVKKNVKVSEFKDEFNPYFIGHSRKIKFFRINFLLRLYNEDYTLNEKKMYRIMSLITSKVNTIQLTPQNQHPIFYNES